MKQMLPGMAAPQAQPAMPTLSKELQQLMQDPEKLQELMEAPSWEEVEALLKDDTMLGFKIDIETDSTIKADQEAEKQARIELISTVTSYIQQAQMVQDPTIKIFLAELLAFGVRGFRAGKQIEGALNLLISKVEKEAKNPAPPPPDPEQTKIQAMTQIEQQKLQSNMQIKQQEAQLDLQKEQMKIQMSNEHKAIEEQRIAADQQRQMQLEMERIAADLELQKYKFDKELEMKRELAMMEFVMTSAQDKENAERERERENEPEEPDESKEHMTAIMTSIAALQSHLLAPKKASFVRDKNGNIQSATVMPEISA